MERTITNLLKLRMLSKLLSVKVWLVVNKYSSIKNTKSLAKARLFENITVNIYCNLKDTGNV